MDDNNQKKAYDPLEEYRQTLGVSKDSSEDEIKKQYRKLVKQYHPDHQNPEMSDQHFKKIVLAYEHLLQK